MYVTSLSTFKWPANVIAVYLGAHSYLVASGASKGTDRFARLSPTRWGRAETQVCSSSATPGYSGLASEGHLLQQCTLGNHRARTALVGRGGELLTLLCIFTAPQTRSGRNYPHSFLPQALFLPLTTQQPSWDKPSLLGQTGEVESGWRRCAYVAMTTLWIHFCGDWLLHKLTLSAIAVRM